MVYERLPSDIATRQVLLMDPLVGTGRTACRAVQVRRDYWWYQVLLICARGAVTQHHAVKAMHHMAAGSSQGDTVGAAHAWIGMHVSAFANRPPPPPPPPSAAPFLITTTTNPRRS